jgi:hypothetical protein
VKPIFGFLGLSRMAQQERQTATVRLTTTQKGFFPNTDHDKIILYALYARAL